MIAGFVLTLIGVALQATKPEVIAPAAAIVLLVSIVVLFKPIPMGWLRYRATAAGLFLSALALLITVPGQNSADPTQITKKTDVRSDQKPEAKPPVLKKQAAPSHPKAKIAEPKPNPLQDRTKQLVWIAVSKDAVRARLKDPDGARFQNVIFHAYQGKTPVVCGEVNSKNSFGGYAGFQGFIASGKTQVHIQSDFRAGEFAKVWNEICRR